MTKSLKNKLLLALTALLTVILTIFGVSIATPLQSAKADTFSCDHKENLVVLSNGEDVRGKTLRIEAGADGAGTEMTLSNKFMFFFTPAIEGLADANVGCGCGGPLEAQDYITWTYCGVGNHFDLTVLPTASYVIEEYDFDVFSVGNIDYFAPVYVVSEEEPGTDTEQPEQKPTDTTNWFKHEYTSGASVQGQYVRFECASGHGEMFTFHLYGLSSNSIPLAYTNGEIKTTAGYEVTGEAVVLRTTDTIVDVFFSSDFAVDKNSAFDAEKMLGQKKSVSIFLLSQDGTLENNPSIPVVPDNPNTDGSSDEKPDNTDEKDLLDNVRDWLDGASEWINENTGAQLSSGALLVIAVVAVVIVLSKKR